MLTSESPPRPWTEEARRFVEAGGNTTHSFGLGQMIGRVYALLYLTPEPMALEDIATRLSVSKASASIVVRQLAGWHAVRQVWMPGDRRDFYEAETQFAIILKEGLMAGVRKKLHSAGAQIERTLAAGTESEPAPPASGAASEDGSGPAPYTREQRNELRRRLRAAQTLHRRLDRLLSSKLLSRFL